jgi:hypothetical protein
MFLEKAGAVSQDKEGWLLTGAEKLRKADRRNTEEACVCPSICPCKNVELTSANETVKPSSGWARGQVTFGDQWADAGHRWRKAKAVTRPCLKCRENPTLPTRNGSQVSVPVRGKVR